MPKIHNPILPGFNPDPCICRVGDDYYIVTSTFEWYPGVQIHYSRDLVNWKLIGHALTRKSQMDLRGIPHSGGIWAPALSYAKGKFWLVYTVVHSHGGPVFDTPNFLVTAESIQGPWSDPVRLHSAGFDPSLFTDEDGQQYLISMEQPEESVDSWFNGIILQRYDHATGTLEGAVHRIWTGTDLGLTEGPHIFRKDGAYYLITAEGGTLLAHALTVARSRDLLGPYELAPDYPLLTAHLDNGSALKSAGHGNFVQTQSGDWYCVHLCTRPILRAGAEPIAYTNDDTYQANYNPVLGRETAIQKVDWTKDGWPRLSQGERRPQVEVDAPDLPVTEFTEGLIGFRESFLNEPLNIHLQSLREPIRGDWCRVSGGVLYLRGRQSLHSHFEQSMVMCRLQSMQARFELSLSFPDAGFRKAAGLLIYTDNLTHKYFRLSADMAGTPKLGIYERVNGKLTVSDIELPQVPERLHLRMDVDNAYLKFYWSEDATVWTLFEPVCKSTELGNWAHGSTGGFTGTFVGMACQDTLDQSAIAQFHSFVYEVFS